jgi:glyceraldehyde 3-phosphate dehydrogenase
MTITLGINGFGHIGQATLAHVTEAARDDVQVVSIDATGPIESNAHLLRRGSVHGRFGTEARVSGDTMNPGRGPMKVLWTCDPEALDREGCGAVLECKGKFTSREAAAVHLTRAARRVLVPAPAKGADKTVVCGVHHRELEPRNHVVSNGSCVTNCLSPLARVLHEAIGIESGLTTTIHRFTGDQPTLDRRHKDLCRTRARRLPWSPPPRAPQGPSRMCRPTSRDASTARRRAGPRPTSRRWT